MKRVHILLLFLIILGAAVWLLNMQQATPVMPEPTKTIPTTSTGSSSTGALIDSGSVLSGELLTGTQETGSIDDTVLPLDKNMQASGEGEFDAQETDPEVEEIINLLEELIAEEEQK